MNKKKGGKRGKRGKEGGRKEKKGERKREGRGEGEGDNANEDGVNRVNFVAPSKCFYFSVHAKVVVIVGRYTKYSLVPILTSHRSHLLPSLVQRLHHIVRQRSLVEIFHILLNMLRTISNRQFSRLLQSPRS